MLIYKLNGYELETVNVGVDIAGQHSDTLQWQNIIYKRQNIITRRKI